MFSGQLPPYLDVRKLADQGATIEGQTTVASLPRLSEFEDSQDEIVDVRLVFARDREDGARTITGSVSTQLTFPCQRCLAPVTCAVDASVNLEMIWSETQERSLPDSREAFLVTQEKMPLASLLEEELLLALPLVALHDTCPDPLPVPEEPAPVIEKGDTDNPFAVLAELKKGRSD
ncbi:MAG: YceD family protein [Alcanivoracaceae bacterium]|nr:YceD family protein [Alcanivoracaceae bacterium]